MKPVARALSRSSRFVPGLAAAALAGACGTEPPLPASIAVSPPSATLPWLGDTVQLTAAVRDTAGRTMRGVTVVWTSEDESVATVDATGLVTAVAKGVTLVRAKAGWVEDLATVTVAPDRRALLSFYEALNGSRWPLSENWGTDAPLDEWHGVAADSKDNVLALELSNNGLSGTIPPEIGALGALQELQLGSWLDALTGEIPPEIGNLDNLRYLHLSGNELTGAIPPELGSLRNLQGLYLYYNELTGAIPPELGNLRNLRYLNLSRNELTGAIPPEIGSLDGLDTLNLSRNELTGPVPPEIGNLRNLLQLKLDQNTLLSGRLPRELIGIPLVWFTWYETDLCYPADQEFQRWLWGIRTHSGNRMCSS